jgi:hypothetical protein
VKYEVRSDGSGVFVVEGFGFITVVNICPLGSSDTYFRMPPTSAIGIRIIIHHTFLQFFFCVEGDSSLNNQSGMLTKLSLPLIVFWLFSI